MKRFYKSVNIEPANAGFQIMLDGRGIKTAMGKPQELPTRRLAEAMAQEWDAQGEQIDRALFRYRDLADFAIDLIPLDREGTITKLLNFIETDTLCYRADPDEAFFGRQAEVWDPLLDRLETAHNITLERVSGIMHRPQAAETHAVLRAKLDALDHFALASTLTMASLSSSLSIALLAAEQGADQGAEQASERASARGADKGADIHALWAAANLEEDWQIEQWGQDWEAEDVRIRRTADFLNAFEFGRLSAQ